jgi:PadR family transcriptional regulator, regulatory protein PadR
MADDPPLPLLPGTIDLLILRALRWEPTHGAGVAAWMRLVTGGAFALEEGTVYPALHRLEQAGFIESEWGRSERKRKARFYNLTGEGRLRLRQMIADWGRYRDAVEATIRHGDPRAFWAEEPGRTPLPTLAPDRSSVR